VPRSNPIRFIVPIGAGAVIWFLPAPAGVSPEAWHLFSIFIATIVGMVLEPLPMGAVAACSIAALTVTGTLGLGEALSGFSHPVIWLVLIAFFLSRGFIKTGLGVRIAYSFIRLLGRKTLGLAYAMTSTELVLAPAIPSITARGGAVIYPIVRAVAEAFDSRPGDGTERRVGAFLVQNAFHANLITSAMFLTAMAANPLAVQLAADQGIEITWARWALAGLVPGLASLLLVPLVLYRLCPPKLRETPAAHDLARAKLAELGPMRRGERIMLGTFVLLLSLWIFGNTLHVDSTVAALLGLTILLTTRTLTWDDVLNEKGAWNTFVWLSALVMMGGYLADFGLVDWFGRAVGDRLTGVGWLPAGVALSLIYFYSHYFLAGNTTHISSMYAAFLGVALVAGVPPLLAALVLAFFSNLSGSMTHYSNGPAPVFFGAGYVTLAEWWKLGAIVSAVNLAIWLAIGGWWWKLIGVW